MAFNFKKIEANFKKQKRTLPKKLGNMAVRHFVKGFRDGGFTDEILDPWVARKKKTKRNAGRAILVDRGHLRRGIKRVRTSFRRTVIGAPSIPYGSFHNEGEGHNPKRQFTGKSGKLNRAIRARIVDEIKTIFD